MEFRYRPEEREEILNMFLGGIDEVNYEVLREAVELLRRDRARIDRVERIARQAGELKLEFRFTVGQTLRHAMDRAIGEGQKA